MKNNDEKPAAHQHKKNRKTRLEEYRVGPRHNPGWTWSGTVRLGGLRILSRGRAVFQWRDLYHSLIALSWPAFFGCVIAWYASANLLFGGLFYFLGPAALGGLRATDGVGFLLECFFFSVQTLATIGYGRINPETTAANFIVAAEALYGLMSVAVITGLLFARFSRPTSQVHFSNVALITTMDGEPHLTFRVSNERASHIVEANVSVFALITEYTKEGQRFRNWHELKLEHSHSPLLSLTWLIAHPIDGKSPLHGMDSEAIQRADIQIFATVWGVDEKLGQTVYSRYLYRADDVVFNAQFEDMITVETDRILVDRAKLHDYVSTTQA